MAIDTINIGASPNDGTGDPLRTAFQKCNSNFGDLNVTKENVSNKSTSTSLGTSDTLYPSQKAVKTYVDAQDATKQNTLVSGTNIKTIEGQSILGSGNIDLSKSDVGLGNVDNTSDLNKPISTATQTALNAKQNTLVSGTNIKTINGNSVLGSGDLIISTPTPTLQDVTDVGNSTTNPIYLNGYQPLFALNDSMFLNANQLPDGNAYTSADKETCIGVFDNENGGYLLTSRYSKRFIYCENGVNTPILAVYNGGKSIDFDITINNVSNNFYLMCKGFARFDFSTEKYTYKIEWLDEVDATFQSLVIDPNSLNINFDFDSNRFRLKLDNQTGNDLYVNINANIN